MLARTRDSRQKRMRQRAEVMDIYPCCPGPIAGLTKLRSQDRRQGEDRLCGARIPAILRALPALINLGAPISHSARQWPGGVARQEHGTALCGFCYEGPN